MGFPNSRKSKVLKSKSVAVIDVYTHFRNTLRVRRMVLKNKQKPVITGL